MNVKTSKRRNVETSKRRNVKTSKRQNVKTSKRRNVETSGRIRIWRGTPIDLGSLLKINKPALRVRYELGDEATAALRKEIQRVLAA